MEPFNLKDYDAFRNEWLILFKLLIEEVIYGAISNYKWPYSFPA